MARGFKGKATSVFKASDGAKGGSDVSDDKLNQLEDILGYKFQDRAWLLRALTHSSASHKNDKQDYERLEYLGDAVLDLAVAHLLLERHPEAKEGELSKMRAALVNMSSLSELAREFKLGPFIKLGRGEQHSGGADRPSILSDVLEAIWGAIYRDSGFPAALLSVEKMFGERLMKVNPRDPKTELQEILHTMGCSAPDYLLECVEGPEHAPNFVSIVKVDGEVLGRGQGNTKKGSQQNAAEEALLALKRYDEVDRRFLVFSPGEQPSVAKVGLANTK